jgi:hypothetical protein
VSKPLTVVGAWRALRLNISAHLACNGSDLDCTVVWVGERMVERNSADGIVLILVAALM